MMNHTTVIPASRKIEEFSAAVLPSGEVVLFDEVVLAYHTLNAPAFAVWKLCDGNRTASQIMIALSASGTPLALDAVELAIERLEEAELLTTRRTGFAGVSRRRLLSATAATAVGVSVVPLVQSITAPTSVSAETGCDYGGQCTTNCCANGGQIVPECANMIHAALGFPANPSWESLRSHCDASGLPADICIVSGSTMDVTYGSITVTVPLSCK